MPDFRRILEILEACGPVAAAGFRGARAAEFKSPGDPVTETDRALSRLIVERLGAPVERVVCEEEALPPSVPADGEVWVIDPLDGTREFVAGVPEFAVSIGLLRDGRLAAGGIFNPMMPLLVVGDRDAGVSVARRPAGGGPWKLLCSRSEIKRGWIRPDQAPEITPMGSIALKLGVVAAGLAEAAVSYEPKNSWDIAGGCFLVARSGGQVTDLAGRPLDFRAPLARIPAGMLATRAGADHGAWLARVTTLRQPRD